jgi:hypothetical protein
MDRADSDGGIRADLLTLDRADPLTLIRADMDGRSVRIS